MTQYFLHLDSLIRLHCSVSLSSWSGFKISKHPWISCFSNSGRWVATVVVYWAFYRLQPEKIPHQSLQGWSTTISLFVKSLLALPHSNADVERVFSQVALIKTKHRNRLKTSTLDALLVARGGLPTDCMHFVPDPEMCKGISASMYDSSSSSNSEDDMDIS